MNFFWSLFARRPQRRRIRPGSARSGRMANAGVSAIEAEDSMETVVVATMIAVSAA